MALRAADSTEPGDNPRARTERKRTYIRTWRPGDPFRGGSRHPGRRDTDPTNVADTGDCRDGDGDDGDGGGGDDVGGGDGGGEGSRGGCGGGGSELKVGGGLQGVGGVGGRDDGWRARSNGSIRARELLGEKQQSVSLFLPGKVLATVRCLALSSLPFADE